MKAKLSLLLLQNIEKKKLKPNSFGYNVYGEEDEFGEKPSVLSKYDEEIEGEKTTSFSIGEEMSEEMRKRKLRDVKEKLQGKTLVSLDLPKPKLASEFYSEEEMTKFKKPKKKVSYVSLIILCMIYFLII